MERLTRRRKEVLKTRFSPLPIQDQLPAMIDNSPVLDYSNYQLIKDVQMYVSFERKLRLDAAGAHTQDAQGNIIGIDTEKAVRTQERNSKESMKSARENAQQRKDMETLFRRIHEELRKVSVR